MFPTIRTALFTSVVLANAGWVHANPAKVHAEVVQHLNKPVTAQANTPEVQQAERRAREALSRATEAQKASEPALKDCAPIYANTALEWAKFRNELAELATLQLQVRAAQKRAADAALALKREQAYLEETEARRGRALAALQQIESAKQNSSNAEQGKPPTTAPTKAPVAPQSSPSGKPESKERP